MKSHKKKLNHVGIFTSRGKKVSIKSHSRRTRGGKRVVVKSYVRMSGKRGMKKEKPSSGSEFKKLKEKSPYGELAEKRLHTFQGPEEDEMFDMKRDIGDKITESKRKVKSSIKDEELTGIEKKLDKFLRKYGYKYKKYV